MFFFGNPLPRLLSQKTKISSWNVTSFVFREIHRLKWWLFFSIVMLVLGGITFPIMHPWDW